MSGSATYGFVLFYDLLAAVSAKQFMDGENIHGNNIRVSFVPHHVEYIWMGQMPYPLNLACMYIMLNSLGYIVHVDGWMCTLGPEHGTDETHFKPATLADTVPTDLPRQFSWLG